MIDIRLLATYTTKLDDQGRFVLPEQLLDKLKTRYPCDGIFSMVTTPSLRTQSLSMLPMQEWEEKVEDYIDSLSDSKTQTLMRRAVVGRGIECELDAEDGFTITEKLIEYASLGEELLIAEYDYKLELWNHDVDLVEEQKAKGINIQ